MRKYAGPYADDPDISRVTAKTDEQEDGIEVCKDGTQFAIKFLQLVQTRAQIAQQRKATVFIMVFGPVSATQDLCIGMDGAQPIILNMDKVREAIHRAAGEKSVPRAIIMSSSALTAGWTCRPLLSGTTRMDRNPVLMQMLVHSCGSAFGSSITEEFTKILTPYLSTQGRGKFRYSDLMPLRPSALQIDNYHRFYTKISETLKHRFCILATEHEFNFHDPQSDAWGVLGRGIRPLSYWAGQWHANQTLGSNGFDFLGDSYGGQIITQVHHLKYLVDFELRTCAGDWENQSTGVTRKMFEHFSSLPASLISKEHCVQILNALEYRASCMALAEITAKVFNLAKPNGKTCRFWKDESADNDPLYRKRQKAFAILHSYFCPMTLPPGEYHNDAGAVRFSRPSRWLAASIAFSLASHADQDMETFIKTCIGPFFLGIRKQQFDLLKEDKTIKRYGITWLKSIIPYFNGGDLEGNPEPSIGPIILPGLRQSTEPWSIMPVPNFVLSLPTAAARAKKSQNAELVQDKVVSVNSPEHSSALHGYHRTQSGYHTTSKEKYEKPGRANTVKPELPHESTVPDSQGRSPTGNPLTTDGTGPWNSPSTAGAFSDFCSRLEACSIRHGAPAQAQTPADSPTGRRRAILDTEIPELDLEAIAEAIAEADEFFEAENVKEGAPVVKPGIENDTDEFDRLLFETTPPRPKKTPLVTSSTETLIDVNDATPPPIPTGIARSPGSAACLLTSPLEGSKPEDQNTPAAAAPVPAPAAAATKTPSGQENRPRKPFSWKEFNTCPREFW